MLKLFNGANMRTLDVKWVKTIKLGLSLLDPKDQKKLIVLGLLQILLSILDLAAIFILGAVSYLAVSGVGVAPKSNKLIFLLDKIGLANINFESQVLVLSVLGVGLFIIKSFSSNLISVKLLKFLATRSTQTSGVLIQKYFNKSTYAVIHSNKNDSIYALSEGVDLLIIKSLSLFATLFSDLFLLIIVSLGLFLIDPIFTLGILISLALLALFLNKNQSANSRSLGLGLSKLRAELSDKIFEFHENYREILSRGVKELYQNKLLGLRSIQSETVAKMNLFQLQSKYIFETSIVVSALLFSLLQFMVKDLGHAIASLAIFLAAGARVAPTVMRMQNSIVQISGIAGHANSTILLSQEKENLFPIYKAVIHNQNSIYLSLSDVYFSYPENNANTLESINLNIKKNSFVAITGPTGSGKSTLLDLCLGFLSPSSGEVLIFGQNAEEFILNNPGKVAIIPQKINILKGTIKENIILGYDKFDTSEDYIWSLLERVKLHDFVYKLPNKLNSTTGEFGSKISGGQRQRIGIARALFTNPEVIGFDEATSSLDAETEKSISKMLLDTKGSFTMITVAHRLSSVREADMLVYLENGKIITTGSFEEVKNSVLNFKVQANLMGL